MLACDLFKAVGGALRTAEVNPYDFAGYALAAREVDTRTLQPFMGHRSIANTVVYTSVADKRIRNIWGK